jgi:hypothetical protein
MSGSTSIIMNPTNLSVEATASIIFGILQLGISLIALWQQWQLRRLQGKSIISFPAEVRMLT